jgi:hypothetical protein
MRGFLLFAAVLVGVLILADVIWMLLVVALGFPPGLQNYVTGPIALIAAILVARRRAPSARP